MLNRILLFALITVTFAAGPLAAQNPTVRLETSVGTIVVELYADKAPITVENFLEYVKSGFYDGTIFHRVIPDFMIQGGGFTETLGKKEPRASIQNEGKNGVKNDRGTLAMARTGDPHSATAQFFINLVDNDFLNQPDSDTEWGYAVFGKVTEGLDYVDLIASVKTTTTASGLPNCPVENVVIQRVTLVE